MDEWSGSSMARIPYTIETMKKVSSQNPKKTKAQKSQLVVESREIPANKSFNILPSLAKMKTSGRVTRIAHHELIGSVNGSTAFTATRYQVNPGLPGTFVWLSSQAQLYEKFRFSFLSLVYVPSEAQYSTPGTVYLAADYDPDDAAPSTEQALGSYETLASVRVFDEGRMYVDARRVQNAKLKVRCGPRAGSRLLYDPCSFIFATVGMTGAAAIGKLYVEYIVELISPQVEPSSPVPVSISAWNLAGSQTFTTTVGTTVNFAESITNGLGLTSTSGSIPLPCGLFKATIDLTFTDSAAENLQVKVQPYLGGSPIMTPVIPSPQLSIFDDVVTANGRNSLSCTFFVPNSTEGSPFTTYVQMTGAAGTLNMVADYCRLFLEAIG